MFSKRVILNTWKMGKSWILRIKDQIIFNNIAVLLFSDIMFISS